MIGRQVSSAASEYFGVEEYSDVLSSQHSPRDSEAGSLSTLLTSFGDVVRSLASPPDAEIAIGPSSLAESEIPSTRLITEPELRADAPSHAYTPRQRQLFADLASYRELGEGWDGQDAVQPSPDGLDRIERLVRNLPPGVATPVASINTDGEVTIYWNDSRIFIELTAEPSGAIYLFLRNKEFGACYSLPNWELNGAGLAQLRAAYAEGRLEA